MHKEAVARLRNVLIKAKEHTLKEISNVKDGGSCNNDSIILYLPRFREDNFHELMNSVGLSGYKSKRFNAVCYKITPPGCGLGNKRLKSMEVMVDYLRACGCDCGYFYQMD